MLRPGITETKEWELPMDAREDKTKIVGGQEKHGRRNASPKVLTTHPEPAERIEIKSKNGDENAERPRTGSVRSPR